MVEFFGTQIKNGEIKLEDVQAWWRKDVKAWLDKNMYNNV